VFPPYSLPTTHFHESVFDWNNKKIGMLIGSIGIMSAVLQGGYVRRATAKIGEGVMARRGVASCAMGLSLLALLPHFVFSDQTLAIRLLQGAAVCMAFTSATVVNSLTAFASLQCDEGIDDDTGKPLEEHPQLAIGKALGRFRSSGQLGRAIGPLLGCCTLSPRRMESDPVYSLCVILDIRPINHVHRQYNRYVLFVAKYDSCSHKRVPSVTHPSQGIVVFHCCHLALLVHWIVILWDDNL
jgi:hypothetical protein